MTDIIHPKEDLYVTDRILTPANVISFLRLCLVPVYLILLYNGHDITACILFAIAALTDFIDGQVARRTNTVSKLGRLLDPAIDTILMITGVVGACAIGRLPVWIVVFVFIREAFLLIAGAVLLKLYEIRVPVIYPGKVATTLLFVGIAGLLLNIPILPGLGILDAYWLPGFGVAPASWAIWFVYVGFLLQVIVTVYYCVTAYKMLKIKLKGSKTDDVR